MTQPPRQPGPDGPQDPYGPKPGDGIPGGQPPHPPGYGQQPGGSPQHGGPGGGWPHHQPPPGPDPTRQYTQPAPYPADPTGDYGPTGAYGQPQDPYGGGYGPPGAGGPPGGFDEFDEADRERRKRGVLIGVAVAAALLVVGGIVALILILGGNEPEDEAQQATEQTEQQDDPAEQQGGQQEDVPPAPDVQEPDEGQDDGGQDSAQDQEEARDTAETAMQALNERDTALARSVSCDPDEPADDAFDDFTDEEFRLTGDPVIDGDSATAPFEVTGTDPDNGEKVTESRELSMNKESGRWCVT
ncbi:hypothetical protein SAMN06265360_119104 [Haloechinothrix alba]|uniref:Uncharacterized protein n=1 Tax=Haloechinothrix alba TaxID=664784 RepID=A0A238Z8S7_9PSEU|nr:hypothetical protein [Haloechinothrix alba]SNR79368.1 hypothetical protein SAMN06265360_119104 [Haloechinothrix alba]